jgi:hypothetical protein
MTLTAEAVTGQPFSFKRFRELYAALDTQEGVYGAGDFKVRQRAAGANMSVEVDPGDARVDIDSGVRNGAAHVLSDAVENPAVGASHATLPRVDSIVVQYNDTGIPAGVGGNVPTVRVVPGTATAGATLDNRTGAPGGAGGPAFPGDALLIGDVLVPAASSSVITANIRDRRRWARGAHRRILRNAANYTITNTTQAAIDATNLSPRIECSGAPLHVELVAIQSHTSADTRIRYSARLDAVAPDANDIAVGTPSGIGDHTLANPKWRSAPAAGSHIVAPYARVDGGTGTIYAVAAEPLELIIEEIVRQDAENT